jgi:hypothetical protein
MDRNSRFFHLAARMRRLCNCWIHVSKAADEEAADEEAADEETADVEADMSFSFNKILAIWICQFLLGLI